ncbi:DNA recombination protein RmuC [Sphingomonas sp.]|jgi:DNA recombination protein RmuC|uniref:DNA recombination protein RmuC n=1 Tax=Sphingomonas sp. TaxID=28214 RepID=UPI002D7E4477|nr:DNA recombination protein RmuC [Sphingomonas sp.]HEU0044708.1 DNA recombination protein RmuC [Sphingomonas sp.]
MRPELTLTLVAVLALAAGLLIGWLIASRRSATLANSLAVAETRIADADLVRQTRDAVERERNEALQALAAARAEAGARDEALVQSGQQLTALSARLEKIDTERGQLATELAALRSQSAARDEAHRANLEAMRTHFEAAAGKALETAQTKFLDRAHQRFAESEKLQGEKLSQLLAPVNDRLQRYEETVTKVEQERRSAFGELDGQIKAMREGQERVSSEAARLVNALRNAPKARGRWGEQQLRNVLETCGLAEHTDFAMEVSVADGEGGRLRPDAIVRVPGGKSLIIDAKVSLNSYQDAINAIDEVDRKRAHEAHALSMRTHVNGLSGKSYWQQFEDTPEYVVMFVPGEHFLTAALEHDPDLWDHAFDKRVLLATPTNLIAIARTVDAVWKQEKLAKEAREIGALGKDMYARIQVMAEHVMRMGKSLDGTVEHFNKFIGSLDRNVLTTAKKLEAYKMDAGGKLIDTPALVDRNASSSAKLVALPEAAE